MLSNTTLSNSNVNTNIETNITLTTVPWDLTTPKPVKPTILGEVVAFTDIEKKVINYFSSVCNKYKLFYGSQIKIAQKLGISLSYFKKILKKLCDLGLMAKKWTGYNKPCWYKMSTWFNDEHVRYTLSKTIPFFYYMAKISVTLLISPANADELRCINDLSLLYPSLTKATTSSTTILSKTKKGKKMFEAQTEVTEQVQKLNLKLTITQQQQLSRFPETVITRAEQRIKFKKNANDPVSYFFWLCKDELANPTQAKEVVKKVVATKVRVEEAKEPEKTYTAVEIANEISKTLEMPNNAPMVIDEKMFQEIKHTSIRNILRSYTMVTTGEPCEEIALVFIEQWRIKVFPPVIEKVVPVKQEKTDPAIIAAFIKNAMENLKQEQPMQEVKPKPQPKAQPEEELNFGYEFEEEILD